MESKNNLIYFNNNKSTKIDDAVKQGMDQFEMLNASEKEKALIKAKDSICNLLNCEASELIYTKGTSHSIQVALQGIFDIHRNKKPHLITSQIEHPAVIDKCRELEAEGLHVTYLKVNPEGLIDPDELRAEINPDTVAVCIMAANNETGVIQPIEKISSICKEQGLIFFSDASQYVGKMRTDVKELEIDSLAFGAHKMYGPQGIGILYIRKELKELREAVQSLNTGNEIDPVLFIGLGKAAELSIHEYWENNTHISRLKNHLEHQLLDIEGLRINGSTRYRLYNTSNLYFPAEYNLGKLQTDFEFADNKSRNSRVLESMGLSADEIKNSYRFSFGKFNTLEEVNRLIICILQLNKKI